MADTNSPRRLSERRLRKERVAPNIQRVVREVDSRALKQFLGGYIRFHPELNTALKLLLGVQVGEIAGVEEIYRLIDELWRKNRRKIDQKRSQKKLEFLLLSSVGVSADALSEKNYQLAAAHCLAMHQWMVDVSEDLHAHEWAVRLYQQLLEVVQGLFKSDMAPQLMDEMIKGLINDYQKPDSMPYGGLNIWDGLYQAEKLDQDTFIDGLMKKLSTSDFPLAFFASFLDAIDLTDEPSKKRIRQWVQSVPPSEILDELHSASARLADGALFFMLFISEKWTTLQRDALKQYIAPRQKFILDLHYASLEAAGGIWQEWAQRSSWNEEERSLLMKYRQKMASERLIAFAIDQLLTSDRLPLPEVASWDWADRLRVLPFIKKAERKELLIDFKQYCIEYARNHMGHQAIEHIRDLGRILMRLDYHREWVKVRDALQKEFGYRKSFRQW